MHISVCHSWNGKVDCFLLLLLAEESIRLIADPPQLNKSGEWVNISWNGVYFPTKDDWVGVWVLPNASVSIDAKKQAPIKFQVSIII